MATMDEIVPEHLRPNNWHELLGDLLAQGWGFWPVHNRLKSAAARADSAGYIRRTLERMATETPIPPAPITAGGPPGRPGREGSGDPGPLHTTDLGSRARGIGRTIDHHTFDPQPAGPYCDYCQLPAPNRIHHTSSS